jgi:hypothetical protein
VRRLLASLDGNRSTPQHLRCGAVSSATLSQNRRGCLELLEIWLQAEFSPELDHRSPAGARQSEWRKSRAIEPQGMREAVARRLLTLSHPYLRIHRFNRPSESHEYVRRRSRCTDFRSSVQR